MSWVVATGTIITGSVSSTVSGSTLEATGNAETSGVSWRLANSVASGAAGSYSTSMTFSDSRFRKVIGDAFAVSVFTLAIMI